MQNVTIHNAPTAEHLKLLREMREEIHNEILLSAIVRSSVVDVAVVAAKGFGQLFEPVFCVSIKFVINNQEYIFREDIQGLDYALSLRDPTEVQKIMDFVKQKVSSVLTEQVMGSLVTALDETLRKTSRF